MGISRIEQPDKHNFGYYVRLTRNGKQQAKFFSDRKYKGKRAALRAAKEYYEELVQNAKPVRRKFQMTVRNTSGRVGVSRTKSTSRGYMYEYWQASVGSGSERRSVKYAVSKYGEEEARRLAEKVRRKWEKEVRQAAL